MPSIAIVAGLAALIAGLAIPRPTGGVLLAQAPQAVAGAEAALRAVRERGRLRVIATLTGGAALAGPALEAARRRLEGSARASGVRGDGVEHLGRLPFAVLEVDARQLESLLRSGLVESVREDLAVPPGRAGPG